MPFKLKICNEVDVPLVKAKYGYKAYVGHDTRSICYPW